VSIRLLNRHTRNPFRSCISRSTSQSHSLSDSISQRTSLFTYHLVHAGYSPVLSSRFTLITSKTLVNSPTDYASSGSGSEHRIVTYAELATDPTQLKSSRACHRHVTPHPSLQTVSELPSKPLKRLLFHSPLPKGEGVRQALVWNQEQLLDLRRLWELRRQRHLDARLIPMAQPPPTISDSALGVENRTSTATGTLLLSLTHPLTSPSTPTAGLCSARRRGKD
jgi:hypothetical protein